MEPDEVTRQLLAELAIEEARYAAESRHCETFAAECKDRNPRYADYLRKRAKFVNQLARDAAAFRDTLVAEKK